MPASTTAPETPPPESPREVQRAAVIRTQMLIRKPVAEVFQAFIDPAVTTQFWFTKSSGKLEVGKRVRWEWGMYGVSADITVKAIEEDKRILIEWPNPVEWVFAPRTSDTTSVTITTSGFDGTDAEIVKRVIDEAGGFALVVAGCKAWLEHGVALNLVADHDPEAHKAM